MIVGRTYSRNFRASKNHNSFVILEVYIGAEAEEFFSLDNALLRVLAHIF